MLADYQVRGMLLFGRRLTRDFVVNRGVCVTNHCAPALGLSVTLLTFQDFITCYDARPWRVSATIESDDDGGTFTSGDAQ